MRISKVARCSHFTMSCFILRIEKTMSRWVFWAVFLYMSYVKRVSVSK